MRRASQPSPARRRALAVVLALPALAAPGGHVVAAAATSQAPHPGTPPAEVAQALPGASLHGHGSLRFLGLRVYDAWLWSPLARRPLSWPNDPLALELRYHRALKGQQIAERSLTEMRRQRPLDDEQGRRWLAAMQQLFPDVRPGDRITGLFMPGTAARFAVNGRPAGEVADPLFAELFFGIWLSPQTSEPGLRLALLGQP